MNLLSRLTGQSALVGAALMASFSVFSAPTGKLTVAVPAEPATLDPHKSSNRYNYTFNSNMFEGLYIRNDKSELVPGLAESVSVTPDGLTYTFKLRKGVKFHDGSAMTADDVKFSMDRAINPATKNPLLAYIKTIDRVDIVNPETVAVKLKERDAIFLKKLAFAGWIIPKNYFQTAGEDGFAKKPMGTGPFKFVSRSINEQILMEANEMHWGWVPKIKSLVMRTVPEDAVRLAMVQTGEADVGPRCRHHWSTVSARSRGSRPCPIPAVRSTGLFSISKMVPKTVPCSTRRSGAP
jgi:peptide/nickel transport system substrate-binding protein